MIGFLIAIWAGLAISVVAHIITWCYFTAVIDGLKEGIRARVWEDDEMRKSLERHDSLLKGAASSILELNSLLTHMEKRVDDEASEVGRCRVLITALNAANSCRDDSIKSLKSFVDDLEKTVCGLREMVTSAHGEVDYWRAECTGLKEHVKNFEQRLADGQFKDAYLRSLFNTLRDDLSRLTEDTRHLEKQFGDQTTDAWNRLADRLFTLEKTFEGMGSLLPALDRLSKLETCNEKHLEWAEATQSNLDRLSREIDDQTKSGEKFICDRMAETHDVLAQAFRKMHDFDVRSPQPEKG